VLKKKEPSELWKWSTYFHDMLDVRLAESRSVEALYTLDATQHLCTSYARLGGKPYFMERGMLVHCHVGPRPVGKWDSSSYIRGRGRQSKTSENYPTSVYLYITTIHLPQLLPPQVFLSCTQILPPLSAPI
jgi:hypothetical protein